MGGGALGVLGGPVGMGIGAGVGAGVGSLLAHSHGRKYKPKKITGKSYAQVQRDYYKKK